MSTGKALATPLFTLRTSDVSLRGMRVMVASQRVSGAKPGRNMPLIISKSSQLHNQHFGYVTGQTSVSVTRVSWNESTEPLNVLDSGERDRSWLLMWGRKGRQGLPKKTQGGLGG